MTKRIRLIILASATLWAMLTAAAHAGCFSTQLQVGAIMRYGVVCKPADTVPGPWPLVLAYHGRGGNGESMAYLSGLHLEWPEALVVYPDAVVEIDGDRRWQIAPGEDLDRDVAFTDAIVNAASSLIDRKQIYAVGYSNGGRFVGVLWVKRGAHLAALGFASGQSAGNLIQSSPPRPVFMGMGLNDEVAPFSWQKEAIAYAAALLKVNTAITPISYNEGVQSLVGETGLELKTLIHTAGHNWPAGQTQLMVNFFKSKKLD